MKISRRNFIRLGLLALAGGFGGKGFYNSRRIGLSRLDISLERLPPAFDGFRIGHVTDLHAGPLTPPDLIRQGIERIMATDPDVLALTGDFVSGATKFLWTTYGGFRERDLQALMTELRRVTERKPAYAVLGNHDFWSGPKVARRIDQGLRDAGVTVLRNESRIIEKDGRRLFLAGIDDYWEDSHSLPATLKNQSPNDCCLLLSHNPDVNEEIEAQGRRVDLVLAGHTHGGQVVLPFIGAPFLPSSFGQKYRAGLVRDGERQTYVSRGLGSFFIPVRLNCPPEVTLITLKKG